MAQLLEQDELKKLQEQQQNYTQTLLEIGSAEVAIADFETRLTLVKNEKANLFNDLKTLKQQAEAFQKELTAKYGNIDVNINTGEFTSLPE